jgi:hypothetical protein
VRNVVLDDAVLAAGLAAAEVDADEAVDEPEWGGTGRGECLHASSLRV